MPHPFDLMKPDKSPSPIAAGFLFALASAALFAIRPIFVKLVYAEQVDPTTLIAFRMLFSVPIYAVLLVIFLRDPIRRAKLTTRNVLASAVVGFFGYYFASFLDLLGLQYVTAQLGRMLLYIYPTFVVILGGLFFGKPITLRTLVSLSLTYLGVLVIFGHDLQTFGSDVIVGALFIVGSALSFSLYLLFGKSLITELGSRLFTCIALISASIGILIHYSITHSISAPQVNQTALWWILVIAIFCTVIPTFLTTAAVERIGADRTGIVAMVGPGFTSIFAVAILSESFTIYHLVGIIITIIGVSLLQRRQAPQSKKIAGP
jgi:drug/metabolite transporter (DMT)-like permease